MDPIVQEYFRKKEELEKAERDKLLIDLGLFTLKTEYYDTKPAYSAKRESVKYDFASKKFVVTERVPAEVSDDELKKILEYEARKKAPAVPADVPRKKRLKLEKVNRGAERTLNFLLLVYLIYIIIVSIACIIIGVSMMPLWDWIALVTGIIVGLLVFIGGWITWCLLKIVLNMSNNLHNISRVLQADKEL